MTSQPQSEPGAGATHESHVELRREGRVVASADVTCSPEPHGTAKVAVAVRHDGAHLDPHGDLVDRVMDTPGVSNSDRVHAVVPLADSESISRLQDRTTNFSARAAGASSVIDADVAHPATDDE